MNLFSNRSLYVCCSSVAWSGNNRISCDKNGVTITISNVDCSQWCIGLSQNDMCMGTENGTHIVFMFGLEECGATVKVSYFIIAVKSKTAS